MTTLRALWNNESGMVVSAELVLVLTIAVIGMIVGLSEVAVAVNTELNDVSNAIGALDQSFFFTGLSRDEMSNVDTLRSDMPRRRLPGRSIARRGWP